MTATTIQRWLSDIPDEALPHLVLGKRLTNSSSRCLLDNPASDWDAQRFALAYRHPDFGWRFTAVLSKFGLPFPVCVEPADQVLWRAYLMHCNQKLYRDRALLAAMGLMHKDLTMQRDTVNSLLISRDMDMEGVARLLGMEVETLKVYERLFFNVEDRKQDAMYMQGIVYPKGRMEEFMQDYLPSTTVRNMLLRAGVNNGVEHALYHAGVSNDLLQGLAASPNGEHMEALIMAQGYVLARAGLLNQDAASVPGIMHSQRLIAAGKMGGVASGNESAVASWGSSIRDELRAYGDEQLGRQQRALIGKMAVEIDADVLQDAGSEMLGKIKD